MTRRASALLLAGLVALLPGCAPERPQGPDRREAVAADEARLDTVAAALQQRPGVVCVNAFLDDEGLPYTRPGSPAVLGRTRGLDDAQRDALAREAARAVWSAGLTSVVALRVELREASGDTSDLGLLLTGRFGRVEDEVLARELGPRPTTAAPPPPAGAATPC